ncbi:MAG: hypothetical protein HYW77_00335 [Parcubacteria group bacterium]|nr:hypothetical protein [Parcubacteria group bacterium]
MYQNNEILKSDLLGRFIISSRGLSADRQACRGDECKPEAKSSLARRSGGNNINPAIFERFEKHHLFLKIA